MLELTADKAQSLKEFTENNYAQAAFCFRALLKSKEIKVNGKKVNENILLQTGDTVQYYLTKKQEESVAFYTVYKDDHVLVVDKESGVNSEAVYAALVREYGENCRFIHRLDRNTKGLLVFAFGDQAERELLESFRMRRVKKVYHAICVGRFAEKNKTLTAYLKKDGEKSLVRIFDKPVAGAEQIITEYAVLEENDGLTKVEITLHTGKTHQIRAHLAHVGCPVLGDMKYGDEQENKKRNVSRQFLVAKYLQVNGKTFVSRFEV